MLPDRRKLNRLSIRLCLRDGASLLMIQTDPTLAKIIAQLGDSTSRQVAAPK
jgi:hypothetical protein